jgi:hypothetical protein
VALGLVLLVAAAFVAILLLDRGAPPRATTTERALGEPITLAESASVFANTAFLTGEDTLTLAEGSVVTSNPSNEPTDVTMAAWVNADLTTETLNTAFTSGSTHHGMTYGQGFANMKVQSLADQSWRHSAVTAIPACPNGLDRVLVCGFGPSGGAIAAGEKGHAYKTPPTGTKTIYYRWYGLISSNWYGQIANSFKKVYFRCASTYPAVFLYYGSGNSGSGGVNGRFNFQSPNASAMSASFGAMTRNTWVLWEVVAVCATSTTATDGHLTVYRNGTRVYQRTDFATGATTWGQQAFLNYFGGTGTTTVPDANGTQYSVVGDGFYFSTSASRAAVPA